MDRPAAHARLTQPLARPPVPLTAEAGLDLSMCCARKVRHHPVSRSSALHCWARTSSVRVIDERPICPRCSSPAQPPPRASRAPVRLPLQRSWADLSGPKRSGRLALAWAGRPIAAAQPTETAQQRVISKLCGGPTADADEFVCETSSTRRVVPSAAVPSKWKVKWNTKLFLLKLPPNH